MSGAAWLRGSSQRSCVKDDMRKMRRTGKWLFIHLHAHNDLCDLCRLMAEGRVADLARLFGLASRIHALDAMKAAFRAYIKKAGLALIMSEEKVSHGPSLLPCPLRRREIVDVVS